MINYISQNFSISTFPRCGSTSVLNWCYYTDHKKFFNGRDYGYGHKDIDGSGIHWYYFYNKNFTTECLLQKKNEKILLIRNPIDRFISAYNFLKNNTHDDLDTKLRDVSIEFFIENIERFTENYFIMIHIKPFYDYLKNIDLKIFTYKYTIENIHIIKNYIELKTNCQIPNSIIHLNKSKEKFNLSKKHHNILKDYYAEDFSLLF